MSGVNDRLATLWTRLGPRFLPFADAATPEFPLSRLLRLALFQVSVGAALVLLNGTLNRVMIVELGVAASVVAAMVALPVIFAPMRALVGHRSDTHRSLLGWRRVPYIWFGTLIQFGGLAIMPFALLILSGDTHGPAWVGHAAGALAFLLVGAGLHVTQTAGLALAMDLAPPAARPRVVALLYVMLLLGMVGSSLVFGAALAEFGQIRLIQVIQAAALATLALNLVALWKQEPRRSAEAVAGDGRTSFAEAWRAFRAQGRTPRLLVAVALGTGGFAMQDILLEPYGGEVLGLTVGATTALTALLAGGTLLGFAVAARRLERGVDPCWLAALGLLVGLPAFSAVIFAEPLGSAFLFRLGAVLVGLGGGLFAVGTLTAAMTAGPEGQGGLTLGAWGAAQATAAGLGVAAGGAVRDLVSGLAEAGRLGPVLTSKGVGYSVVYHLEILLLFAALVAIGPLVRHVRLEGRPPSRFGLADVPG